MSPHNLNYRDFSIFNAQLQRPIPMQMRPGYSILRPPSTPDSWRQVFPGLSTNYNICYESPLDPNRLHRCSILGCDQTIAAIDIRQHLQNFHHGYSQISLRLVCTDSQCQRGDLAARSYPKHVLEHHCNIIFLCPYCGLHYTRSQSVTRHIMQDCTAFQDFRHS
ncbi:hypothetical protein EDD18DRAFT_1185890, partial [Armillaria luteobubalina]